jgi:hypothetical protein
MSRLMAFLHALMGQRPPDPHRKAVAERVEDAERRLAEYRARTDGAVREAYRQAGARLDGRR